MQTLRLSILLCCCIAAGPAIAQDFISYYPVEWDFKTQLDLIDFSAVRNLKTTEFTIDDQQELPVVTTGLSWNDSYQLTHYQQVNHPNGNTGFEANIQYAERHGNRLKTVKIVKAGSQEALEEWQYQYGSFDVSKINVRRFLENVSTPQLIEVLYEGNDDDFTRETVYNNEKSVLRQTKYWYKSNKDGGTVRVSKLYLDDVLDQTDSVIYDRNGKRTEQHIINFGISTETKYVYKTRPVTVAGDEFDYQELVGMFVDGKERERYEYKYDAKGNWTERKTLVQKEGRWVLKSLTRREMEYRS